jgi:uncharacterized membrane protein YgdD (TMEM256/DUF423 family)
MTVPNALLMAMAGLLGALGVSLAAAAAHVSGGEAVRAAAEIAMVHAAAVVGLTAFVPHTGRPRLWGWAALAMLVGAALFSGTVSLGELAGLRPLPVLAPIGGSLTILAWIAIALLGALEWVRPVSTERR